MSDYQERIAKALDKKVLEWRERGELWVDIIGDLLPTELERALRATANWPFDVADEQGEDLHGEAVIEKVEAGVEKLEKPT